MSNSSPNQAIGVVLAGGLSRRMDGPEKSLLALNGKSMLQHVTERLESQIRPVIINANGDAERFSFMPNEIQSDIIEGFAGPLAGVVSAMHWAKTNVPEATRIVTAAADTPFFPQDLVSRFAEITNPLPSAKSDETICMAYSDGNRHPVFGSWPIALYEPLKHFLVEENERKVMLFAQRYSLEKIDFSVQQSNGKTFDPFFNINTPEDFKTAETCFEAITQ